MTKQSDDEKAQAASDPFELWRRFYDANEELWSKAARETTSSEAFAQMQGRMLETFLAFQKGTRDALNAQLATFNLPSRDDVARLGELIVGLEEKIDQLDDRLAAIEAKGTSRSAGNRRQAPRKRRA